jgi:hypothetical protein
MESEYDKIAHMFIPPRILDAIKYGTIFIIVASFITAFSSRSKIAYRETSIWARNKLLVSLMVVFLVFLFRAVAKHWGRSHMTWTVTWTEVGTDLLIIIASYVTILVGSFVWNFIFAPARLERERKQELKRKAGQESLNQVLAEEAKKINETVDGVLDADEETNE